MFLSPFFLCGRVGSELLVGLEIAELKAAALEHIRCSLTPDNVVTEICSPFTARFPEVRKIEKEYLKANWVCNLLFIPTTQKGVVTEKLSCCLYR